VLFGGGGGEYFERWGGVARWQQSHKTAGIKTSPQPGMEQADMGRSRGEKDVV
jgi:hypothetical protein